MAKHNMEDPKPACENSEMAAAETGDDDGGLSISNCAHFYVDAEGYTFSTQAAKALF
jgi:hypothetical protein